jgi:hypothetical protein
MSRPIVMAVTAGALLAAAGAASAQEAPSRVRCANCPPGAPSGSLELGLGIGWANSAGRFTSAAGDHVGDYAGAGAAAAVDIGVRVTPRWMLGIYGQGTEYHESDRLPSTTDVRDLTAGVQAGMHFAPYSDMDPWVSVGTGYHGFWVVPSSGSNTSRQGIEIVRARAGLDFRVSPYIALGPVAGADTSLFLSEKFPGDEGFHSVSGERLNFFFFAGLQTRLDLGGTLVRPHGVAAR